MSSIFLIFSLVRTAFSPSLFLLIFSLVGTFSFIKHIKFEKCKALKKELNEELLTVVWHPNRWWDWCELEDEKKEIDPMLFEEL